MDSRFAGRVILYTDRHFHVLGEGWYFEAREGMQGPFLTREAAVARLEELCRQAQRREPLWSTEERGIAAADLGIATGSYDGL